MDVIKNNPKDDLIRAFGPGAAKEWLPPVAPPPEPEPQPEKVVNEDSLNDWDLILEIQKNYQPPQIQPPTGKTAGQGNVQNMSDRQTRFGAPPMKKMVNSK
jgi:hypothetical protein